MKQTVLIAGFVVLVIGAILVFAHATAAGGIVGALGILAIIAGLFIRGRASAAPTGDLTPPITGLDAPVPGRDVTLNEPIIFEPHAGNIPGTTPDPTRESGADIAPGLTSGPPHPPESY